MKAQRFLQMLSVATLATAIGCGGAIDPVASLADANDTNIKRLSNLYLSYQIKNAYRGPKDEEDFKGFLNAYSPKKLERIGIDPSGIDALFISERDGEPFKVRYGIPGSAMGSGEAVVFESTGVEGVRRVGFLNMSQKDVDPAEYEGLLSGSIKAAPPQRGLDPSEFSRAE